MEHRTHHRRIEHGFGRRAGRRLCLGSLGEDTAGSIRNPSAFCGIAGLKATYGRVSRYGLAPLSWSLDHCGPMARAVEDLAHMLNVIAGHDPRDPTSSSMAVVDYTGVLREDVKGMAIGVPRAYIDECAPRTDPIVLQRVEEAIAELKALGARIEEVKVPTLHLATIANAVIYYNEFWAAHKSDAATVLKTGAPQRRARIYLGLLTGSADYIQAQRMRSRCRAELAEVFHQDRLSRAAQSGGSGTARERCRTDRHSFQARRSRISRPVQSDRFADFVGTVRIFGESAAHCAAARWKTLRRGERSPRRVYLSTTDEMVRKTPTDLKSHQVRHVRQFERHRYWQRERLDDRQQGCRGRPAVALFRGEENGYSAHQST